MYNKNEMNEFNKALKKLKESFNRDSKELSKIFTSTTSALEFNFDKLNKLDLKINTKNLQASLDELQNRFTNTSGLMEESIDEIKSSVGITSGVLRETKKVYDLLNRTREKTESSLNSLMSTLSSLESKSGVLKNGVVTPQYDSGNNGAEPIKYLINRFFPESGSKINSWVDVFGKIFKERTPGFSSGGIVPGSFSQPVPVMAHGSEMVLNPAQQGNLFKMLNGQPEKTAQPSFVYAPQIKTGVSAQEVFDVLNNHNRQFFSLVSEGVQKDSSLRNAVRST